MGNKLKKLTSSQLVIPLFALLLIIVFNLIRDASFFSLRLQIAAIRAPVRSWAAEKCV